MVSDITKLTVWNSWGPNGSTTQYVKNNTCVTSWGTTYYQSGGSWVACPSGTQIYSNPSLCENCGDKWTSGYWTTQNGNPYCTQWMSNSYIQENKWLSAWTGAYTLFSQTSQSTIYQWYKAWPISMPYQTSTNEWVSTCPKTAYLDITNSKCVNCPSGMQVYSNPSLWENCGDMCINGYWTTQNNLPVWTKWMNNSYIQEGKWLSVWSGNYLVFSKTTNAGIYQCLKTCTTALPYQTSTNECVAVWPNTAYLDTINSKCIDCPSGMNTYSNPSLCENCGDLCTNGYWTNQNGSPYCTKCMNNSYIQGGKWLSAWTGNFTYYSKTSQSTVMQCLTSCPISLPYVTSNNECVSFWPITSYLNITVSKCINCPVGMQVYSNPSLWENCGDMCTNGYWTSQNNLPVWTKWMSNSYIQEGKWLAAWTGDYVLYSLTSTNLVYQCMKTWTLSLPYQTSSNQCVATWPVTSYLDTSTSKCINCPAGMQVYSNPSLCENCGDKWTDGFWTSQNNLPVWTKWINNSYIQVGKWLSACTGNYKFFIKTSQNTKYQCLTACPSTTQYHLQTNEWVQAWPSTSYIDVSSMQWVDWNSQFAGCNFWASVTDPSSLTTSVKWKQWSSATPYFSSDLSTWVSSCSTGEALVQTSSYGYWLKCPSAWTSWSVSDDKIKCSSWTSGYNYDESSGSWSTKWPLLKYVYNNQCVSSWPSEYSAQLDTGKWVTCSINGWVKCTSLGSYISCDQWAAGRIKSGSLATGYKCDTICDVSSASYWTSNGVCTQVTGYKDA